MAEFSQVLKEGDIIEANYRPEPDSSRRLQ